MFEEDIIKTSSGDLKITFVGHGTLMLTFGEKIIHIDPVSREADYSKMPKGDIILITHEHRDHLAVDPDRIVIVLGIRVAFHNLQSLFNSPLIIPLTGCGPVAFFAGFFRSIERFPGVEERVEIN